MKINVNNYLKIFSILSLAAVSGQVFAEEITEDCSGVEYTHEVHGVNGYFLRFNDVGGGVRSYFVFNSRNGCSLIVNRLFDSDKDRVWLYKMSDLTIPSEYVKPSPIRVFRFLKDKNLESKIVSSEFNRCREREKRKRCREIIGRKTSKNSAILDIRHNGINLTINLYMNDYFIGGAE